MARKIDNFSGPYRFLSNFYPAVIRSTDGRIWPTSEHAYQAMKTKDRHAQEQIRKATTPGRAKQLGKKVPLRKDWNTIRLVAMEKIVYQKFRQHKNLCRQLLETDEIPLEEGNTWGDRVWGTVAGKGANHLGKILMNVRNKLRREGC